MLDNFWTIFLGGFTGGVVSGGLRAWYYHKWPKQKDVTGYKHNWKCPVEGCSFKVSATQKTIITYVRTNHNEIIHDVVSYDNA